MDLSVLLGLIGAITSINKVCNIPNNSIRFKIESPKWL